MSRHKNRAEKLATDMTLKEKFNAVQYGRDSLVDGGKYARLARSLHWMLRIKRDDGKTGMEHIRDLLNTDPAKPYMIWPIKALIEFIEMAATAGSQRSGDELRKLAKAFDVIGRTNDPVGWTLLMIRQPHTTKEILWMVREDFHAAKWILRRFVIEQRN